MHNHTQPEIEQARWKLLSRLADALVEAELEAHRGAPANDESARAFATFTQEVYGVEPTPENLDELLTADRRAALECLPDNPKGRAIYQEMHPYLLETGDYFGSLRQLIKEAFQRRGWWPLDDAPRIQLVTRPLPGLGLRAVIRARLEGDEAPGEPYGEMAACGKERLPLWRQHIDSVYERGAEILVEPLHGISLADLAIEPDLIALHFTGSEPGDPNKYAYLVPIFPATGQN